MSATLGLKSRRKFSPWTLVNFCFKVSSTTCFTWQSRGVFLPFLQGAKIIAQWNSEFIDISICLFLDHFTCLFSGLNKMNSCCRQRERDRENSFQLLSLWKTNASFDLLPAFSLLKARTLRPVLEKRKDIPVNQPSEGRPHTFSLFSLLVILCLP